MMKTKILQLFLFMLHLGLWCNTILADSTSQIKKQDGTSLVPALGQILENIDLEASQPIFLQLVDTLVDLLTDENGDFPSKYFEDTFSNVELEQIQPQLDNILKYLSENGFPEIPESMAALKTHFLTKLTTQSPKSVEDDVTLLKKVGDLSHKILNNFVDIDYILQDITELAESDKSVQKFISFLRRPDNADLYKNLKNCQNFVKFTTPLFPPEYKKVVRFFERILGWQQVKSFTEGKDGYINLEDFRKGIKDGTIPQQQQQNVDPIIDPPNVQKDEKAAKKVTPPPHPSPPPRSPKEVKEKLPDPNAELFKLIELVDKLRENNLRKPILTIEDAVAHPRKLDAILEHLEIFQEIFQDRNALMGLISEGNLAQTFAALKENLLGQKTWMMGEARRLKRELTHHLEICQDDQQKIIESKLTRLNEIILVFELEGPTDDDDSGDSLEEGVLTDFGRQEL